MKKNLYFFIAIILIAGHAFSQVPMFFNTNVAGGANAFPFNNNTTSRKVQWFIPPNSLGAVGPGNNITDVYFQAGATANQTYPLLEIKMKVGTGTGLTGIAGGPPESGLTTVFSANNYVLSTTLGQWFKISLQTPWLYNPALPLIVEVEHNATTGTGPSVYQAVNIPGPGNGRQWANFQAATLTGIGTQQVNFGIDVAPATPCTSAPSMNTVVPSNFTTCPAYTNPNLSFANSYSLGGLTYQWQSSTVSPVGPYTAIPNATSHIIPTPTLGVTTWYQAIVTCTNPGGGSTTLTPTEFYVAGNVTSTVPYHEGFEGLQVDDRLPNCSWYTSGLGTVVTTYMGPAGNNRLPHTGNKFGAFVAPANNHHVFSNGVTLSPGITYSAAIWYSTEYLGYTNWSSLSLLVGPSQSTTGLMTIASVTPVASGPYKLLSGVFTVPTQGDYYIAIKANGSSGSAPYLMFDDLSVTIPCYGAGASNSPTLQLTASSNTICEGDALNLSANGADSYTWSTGANGPTLVDLPMATTLYSLVGMNAMTGCTDTIYESITVNPKPLVFAAAGTPTVCSGSPVHLSAFGKDIISYSWNTGGAGPNIVAFPTNPSTYTVIATSVDGCVGTAAVNVGIYQLPTVLASSDNPGVACHNEPVNLTASGAISYTWVSNTSGVMLFGSSVNVIPGSTSVYTVTGTNANGCSNITTITQNVQDCTGLTENSIKEMKVFPNPTSGMLSVELTNTFKTLRITDITGRVVMETAGAEDVLNVNLSDLAHGVYYLSVNTGDSVQTIKLLKD